jgi:multiple sugar transport system permease protein
MAQETRTLISDAQLRRGKGKMLYWTVLTLVIVVFTLVFIGPLYWMVTGALKSGQEIAQTPPTLFPKHPRRRTTPTRGAT